MCLKQGRFEMDDFTRRKKKFGCKGKILEIRILEKNL